MSDPVVTFPVLVVGVAAFTLLAGREAKNQRWRNFAALVVVGIAWGTVLGTAIRRYWPH
jgi:hypothetical protein